MELIAVWISQDINISLFLEWVIVRFGSVDDFFGFDENSSELIAWIERSKEKTVIEKILLNVYYTHLPSLYSFTP
jgi:hypothetical protein